MNKNVVVIGAGLSGLASAALIAKAGHKVIVLEANSWLGGKSRRIELGGQIIDTGPSLLTFPEVLGQVLETYDQLGEKTTTPMPELLSLAEVGKYFYKQHQVTLPILAGEKWSEDWQRFEAAHSNLSDAILKLLTSSPNDLSTLPALGKLLKVYGINLTAKSYINSLGWMDKELKEIIAIHTLNAGVAPKDTLALFATITAIMAHDGIRVPKGGMNNIAQLLAKIAQEAGAEIRLNEPVTKIAKGLVATESVNYQADLVISSLDDSITNSLIKGAPNKIAKRRSCSGVAIYAVLSQALPEGTVTHSVVMPDDGDELHESLSNFQQPNQTMAFVNYYLPNDIYQNQKPTVAILLTAASDGKSYDLQSDWVRKELDRISKLIGLEKPIDEYFEEYKILDPEYFGSFGGGNGALYGATKPLWQAGPFNVPAAHNPLRPWLYRVGASTHPGGGMPAVLGGALVTSKRVIGKLG
jgi:phytoene desaturase